MSHDTTNATLLGAGSASEGFGWGWKALMQAWRSFDNYSSFVGEFYFQKRFYNHGDNRSSMKLDNREKSQEEKIWEKEGN